MIKIIALGYLGRDPELRYTQSGDALTNFSIASNRKDAVGNEYVIWLNVTVFGKMAEACNQYLSKGRQVFIEGYFVADSKTGGPKIWTDSGGQPRANYDIRASTVKFLNGGNKTQHDQGFGEDPPPKPVEIDEDEIPF